jgi:Tfp pilus assembly protein FimV
MLFRTAIILSLVFLTLLPLFCSAEIKYISLHDVESAPNQPLTLKLNIVEQNPKRLHFTLVNQNVESQFIFKRMNNYMLKLKSPLRLIGEGAVNVYELKNNIWTLFKTIPLTGPESLKANSNILASEVIDNPSNKPINKSNRIEPISVGNTISVDDVTKVNITNDCELTREVKETLWSIASRYKDRWKVDVFGAMIAIYNSNLNSFTNQHIGFLMQGDTLNCPSNDVLSSLGNKVSMRAEYMRLSTLVSKTTDSLANKSASEPEQIESFKSTTKASVGNDCQLTREVNETLWSIASRYKNSWNVDVFGAMLAIYKSNLNRFTHQHIGFLTLSETLDCPSNKILFNLGDKEAMRAEYTRLNTLLNHAMDSSVSQSANKFKKAESLKSTAKVAITNDCQLTRTAKETLWSIASRYKERWKVDVFGAMIAIYNSNVNNFTNKHIGLLMQGSTLRCPSNDVLFSLGNKEAMRTEYTRLINLTN